MFLNGVSEHIEKDENLTTIAPTNEFALTEFGDLFWLNELQPLRGIEGLTPVGAASLRSHSITGVDALTIVTNKDSGCSDELAVILTMPVAGGSIDGTTMLEAVWAAYMLSLKATMDGGKNERAHIGRDADAIDLANAIVARLGATATPCDEVYGSGGTYLEAIDLTYDPSTRTLTANPIIGS